MNKIFVNAILLFCLLIIGANGYVFLEGSSFLDGLYMTMITITTVGFGEVIPLSPSGKYFTMILMLSGVGFVLYLFSNITDAVVEGRLRKVFGRINMDKKLGKLANHFIVCGYGRIGKVICESLHESHRQFVVIENDPLEINEISLKKYLFVEGEASDDKVLEKASIKKAKGLIAVVSSDADNVYIALTARELNPSLFIMARSSGKEGVDVKLLRAGADKVISPYYIGAKQMANMVLRPSVIDFLDLTVHQSKAGLRMEELVVSDSAALANMTLMDSNIRRDYDLIVVAIKRQGEDMSFNPGHLSVIKPHDIIIVLGDYENIKRLEGVL